MNDSINIWRLHGRKNYVISNDSHVKGLLIQLRMTSLFNHESGEPVSRLYVFENHPTHWLIFQFNKGARSSGAGDQGDGTRRYCFQAIPKSEARLDAKTIRDQCNWEDASSIERLNLPWLPTGFLTRQFTGC